MQFKRFSWKVSALVLGIYLGDAILRWIAHRGVFSPISIVSGLGLAVFWLWGEKMWPSVLLSSALGLVLLAILQDIPLSQVWGLIAVEASAYTALVWMGWWATRRLGLSGYPLWDLKHGAWVLVLDGLLLPGGNTLVLWLFLTIWHVLPLDSIIITFGMDIFVSLEGFLFLLVWLSPQRPPEVRESRPVWEVAGISAMVLALMWLVFWGETSWPAFSLYHLNDFILLALFFILPFRYTDRMVFSWLAYIGFVGMAYAVRAPDPFGSVLFFQGWFAVLLLITTVTYCGISQRLLVTQNLQQQIDELARHNRRLAALDGITHAALMASDEYTLLQILADQLGEFWDADGCHVTLWDERSQSVLPGAAYGPFRDTYRQMKVEPGEPTLTEAVLRAGEPIFVPDVFDSPYISRRIAETFPARALLGIPLISGSRWLGGVLVAFHQPPLVLSEEGLDWAKQVGAQISLAIDKAQLYQRTLHELQREQQLNALAQTFSANLDVETTLQRVLSLLVDMVAADAGALALLSEDNHFITYPYLVGNLPASLSEKPTPREGGGLAWKIVETRKYILLDDYRASEYAHPDWQNLNIQAFLGVPLMARDQCLGAVGLFRTPGKSPFSLQEASLADSVARQMGIEIQNALLFQKEQRLRARAEILRDVATDINNPNLDLSENLERMLRRLQKVLGFDSASVFLVEDNSLYLRQAIGLRDPTVIGKNFPVDGNSLFNEIRRSGRPLVLREANNHPNFQGWGGTLGVMCWMGVPLEEHGEVIGYITFDRYENKPYREDEIELANTVASQASTAIAQAHLFQQMERRARQLSVLYELSQQSVRQTDAEVVAKRACDLAVNKLGLHFAWIGLFRSEEQHLFSVGFVHALISEAALAYPKLLSDSRRLVDSVLIRSALHSGTPVFFNAQVNHAAETSEERQLLQDLCGNHAAAFSLRHAGRVLGVMLFGGGAQAFSEGQIRFLQAFVNQVAVALENIRLFADTQRHLEYVQALHAIDMTINASLDLDVTLNVLVHQISQQLEVDAVAIYTLEPHTNLLIFSAGEGFRTANLGEVHWRLGQGRTGRVALNREALYIGDLEKSATRGGYADNLVKEEKFITYYGVPLIAKGQVKGVLEIYHRQQLFPKTQWVEFLNAVAAQAAIAMDNADLFRRLERSNFDLLMAYNTTLEGWSRALELRDAETEGHSERVTKMTIRLAQEMGITGDALTHIRHGALLHDIGKMGVPDAILYKPGPLTDEEWEIMRQHPVYAYRLLSPIPYLREALNIPYCHHERWQGQGYPRGLKGKQIPLAARIFAVVDVWDALSKDRPYRRAWSQEKVRAYLKEQAGIQFDPTVVDVFLRILESEPDRET